MRNFIIGILISTHAFAVVVDTLNVPAPVDAMGGTTATLNQIDQGGGLEKTRDQHWKEEEKEIKRREKMQSEQERKGRLGNDEGQGYLAPQ